MALTDTELAQIRRSGEHFKLVLRDVLEFFPRSARSIAGLARWSGVNKSTCQRLVQAITKTSNGIDVIMILPGISGLKQFEQAVRKLSVNDECLQKLNELVEQYQDLILEFASSQSELKRLLVKFQAKGSASLDSYQKKLKKTAFETNRELSGESVDLYLGIHFFRFNPEDDSFLDEFILANRLGVELAKSARPFVQAFGANFNKVHINHPKNLSSKDLDQSVSNQSGEFLLTDFSTQGIEKSYAGFGSFDNSLVYNPSREPINNRPFDITLAHLDVKTQPNPLTHEHKTIVQGLMDRSPAKRLILMTFIHKKLDRASNIQAGCYPSSVKAHEQDHLQEDFWSERFSDAPEIKLIKPQDGNLNTKLQLDHVDQLVEQSFSFLKEDSSNYVGYFIDVEYPLWLTSHRFYLGFT